MKNDKYYESVALVMQEAHAFLQGYIWSDLQKCMCLHVLVLSRMVLRERRQAEWGRSLRHLHCCNFWRRRLLSYLQLHVPQAGNIQAQINEIVHVSPPDLRHCDPAAMHHNIKVICIY